MSDQSRPFVSVIVPVYNDPEGIQRCLEALGSQTYPEERFEVLVVDNGSTDHTREVIKEFDVELLVEDEVQGSYAARNRGIENAEGEILAFTDADCTSEPEWITEGVKTLEEENADLVGGRVVFEFSEKKTAAERFDASVNMRNDQSVRGGVAKTANVFTKRIVIEDIGCFPQHLRSGGDVYWSSAATDAGYNLVYGAEAIVRHPSRQLRELLRKQYRVGTGQIEIWRLDGQSAVLMLVKGFLQFPLKVLGFFLEEGESEGTAHETPPDRDVRKGLKVAMVAGLCVLAMNIGRLKQLSSIA